MVYPTLLAAIGDVAHPLWRGSAVGVYRLWRDSGYALGALLAGALADMFGMVAAILTLEHSPWRREGWSRSGCPRRSRHREEPRRLVAKRELRRRSEVALPRI